MTYPIRTSSRRLGRFAAGLALVLCLAAPAAAVKPAANPDHLVVVEGQALTFAPEELLANDVVGDPYVFFLDQLPAHGSLSCAASSCTYVPLPDRYGVDRFRYGFQSGSEVRVAEVEVWVSPLLTPVAGDWNGDGLTDVGWFHAARLDFHFSVLSLQGTSLDIEETNCARPPLPAGAEGWIPVVGDWDGDLEDDVALFDPSTRTFHPFDLKTWELVPSAPFQHPDPGFGGLPVAGDWDAAGGDELGLFLPQANLFRLLAPSTHGNQQVGVSFAYTLPSGDWYPLTSKLGTSRGGPDLVAVWEPAARQVRYRLDHAGGTTLAVDDYDQQGVGLRALPFGGSWGGVETVGLFDPDQATWESWSGAFRIFPCDFDASSTCGNSGGGHEPILLPIPEDPVVAVCVN
ncbi:MAG TPA: Ig-like domain-containing protein [Thermoanaerobaculia bacterium]|nr:Ig-like domain-containing protein [Thermoanaerobaculia bacterium]